MVWFFWKETGDQGDGGGEGRGGRKLPDGSGPVLHGRPHAPWSSRHSLLLLIIISKLNPFAASREAVAVKDVREGWWEGLKLTAWMLERRRAEGRRDA